MVIDNIYVFVLNTNGRLKTLTKHSCQLSYCAAIKKSSIQLELICSCLTLKLINNKKKLGCNFM